MYKKLIKYVFFILAWLAILLGTLGIVLPLLPTTPFFIFALFAFSKSSPHFQRWLLNLPGIGNDLRHWQAHKKIDKKRKPKIYALIVISFAISIFMLSGKLYLQLMLMALMMILLFFIKRLPEY